ncbi:SRPBCC family protein [Mycobacterium botniense]|uniref:Carbon monoxide dehydrogenase subunit G n=1 Tax=Mycobacterium botniense TaxID=84962 RepID=A0A7I9XVB0_9MYCO|nr:SRPBCC family protein [Mycobacterium botniense]GFG73566.1 carbon monoxide dehydrogenase subunit G [Mycobacterium botniense]
MELTNEFRVPVRVGQAWEVLTDVQRIAPCLPGAQVLSVDGDEFTGTVKVKVGPITVQYKGKAVFEHKDSSTHRAVIRASGKEIRGQGNAAAVVTAELKEDGDSTTCLLTTDLTISGKAAQFGRGVLADVANKLIAQFAERLEEDLLSQANSAAQPQPAQPISSGAARGTEPIKIVSVVAGPLARRAAPVLAGLLVGAVMGWLLGRRSS